MSLCDSDTCYNTRYMVTEKTVVLLYPTTFSVISVTLSNECFLNVDNNPQDTINTQEHNKINCKY